MAWNDLSKKQQEIARVKISQTLRSKGIRPPSNKGKKFKKEHIEKIIESKRKNGSLYHTSERTQKIQLSRKLYYDKFGRKSNIRDLLEASQKYKIWRRQILSRGHCEICNKTGRLQTHHKKPIKYFIKKYNNDFNQIMKCEELFDPNIGLALCIKCHKIEDKKQYGSKLNLNH